jgi:hypothetical protein
MSCRQEGSTVAATSTFDSLPSRPVKIRADCTRTTSIDMSPQRRLVTSTTEQNPGITTCPCWRAYRPSIATGIARLIRAGLDTCISPRLLINTKSLRNQTVHEHAQLSGLSPTEQTNASNDTASDPLPFDTIHIPRSDHLLQARHRDTRLRGCLNLTKDELACRHRSACVSLGN